MKFECELKTTIMVEFLQPEKTLKFFTEGDWKDAFFTFDDLTEVAEHITNNVARFGGTWGNVDGEYCNYLDIEGFPPFLKGLDSTYITSDSDMGVISVVIVDELDNDYTSEVD